MFSWLEHHAQTQATQANVVASFSPPYTVPLSELNAAQVKVIVTAINGFIDQGKISVLIQGNNGIRLQNNYATSPYSLFMADVNVYQLTDNDFQDLFTPGNFTATGITVAQAFNEGLPPGSYEICFRVYVQGRVTLTPISQAPPLGCSAFVIQDSPTAVMVNSIVQPPPFVPDLGEYLYKINATLQSANARSIRLFLTIKGDNGVAIHSRKGVIISQSIPLQAGTPYMLSSIDLDPYFKIENLTFTGISANAVHNNGLPEGNYRFCIRAVDLQGNFISADDPLGCSNLVSIKLLEPPQLIAPTCGSSFTTTAAQNIVFSWTVPPGAPPGLIYTLRIVEMIDPSKDPNDAMFTATTPAFFEETIVGTTSFLYGPAQPLLEPGRKYAWQVIAGLGTGMDMSNSTKLFRNKGKSAVCWFTWKSSPTLLMTAAGEGKSNNPSVNHVTNIDPVPIAVVKGQLNYKFKTHSNVVVSNKKVGQNHKSAMGMSEKDLVYNKEIIDVSESQPLANVKVSLVMLYVLDGKIDNKKYTNVPIQKNDLSFGGNQFDQAFKGHETVLGTTTTTGDGSFTFQFVHTDNKLGKLQENVNLSFGSGEFFNKLSGTVYKVLRLKVENNYYCSPDINIKVQPWEALDLGTLVSYVKSYDLKVKVLSTTASFYEKLHAKGAGGPLDKVSTSVLRKYTVANVPLNEGNKTMGGGKLKMPGTQNILSSGETDKDGFVLFRNLVKHNPNNNLDRYYISCSTSKTEGLHNYKTKETRYSPFTLTEKKQFPFNMLTKETIKPQNGLSYNEYYGTSVAWNSEFIVETFTTEIELTPELPRIAGKVYNVLAADKPLPGEKVLLLSTYIASDNKNKPVRIAITDSTGRYEFKNLDIEIEVNWYTSETEKKFINELKGPDRTVLCKVKGYKLYHKTFDKLNYGSQLVNEDIPLDPDGWLAGNVVDEEGNPVKASVYVDSIRKDTQFIFQYGSSANTKKQPGKGQGIVLMTPTKGIEHFEMKAPSGKDKTLIIVPADKAYYKEEYLVDVPLKYLSSKKEGKEYKVYRAKKRITFRVLAGKTSTGKLQLPSTPKPLANVSVTLDVPNQKITQISGTNGYVTLEFENNSNGTFDFIVTPPESMDFESTVYSISNIKSGKEVVEYPAVYLKPTTTIEGVVTLKDKNTFVKDALIYIDLGNGIKLKAPTDDQGKYILKKVPKSPQEKTVVASKQDVVPNLISQSKIITLKDQGPNVLNFELEEDLEMVIKDIFGFKVIIEEMKHEPDGSRTIVKGSLMDIPANENFKLYDDKMSLPFSNVKIKKSSTKDASGIPIGVPELSAIPLDLQEIKLSAHDVFGALQKMNSNVQLKVQSKDGVGYISGNVSILQNSFTFSDQYLSIEEGKTFCLSGEKDGGQKELTTLTAGAYPKQKFFITDEKGNDFQFKYLGFNAKADRNQSYLEAEKIALQTILSTEKIPGMTPAKIDLKIGSLVIKTNKIDPVSGEQPVKFNLEKWEVICPKWTIQQNTSGILVPGGTIKTGLLDIPVNNMKILPTMFDASGFDIEKITLSGVMPLTIVNSEKALFGYNSSIGKDQKGHWELRIYGEDGQPGATLANLPGMEPGATIDLNVFSLISNGEQNVSFSPQYKGTTFHKVLKTKPISFSGGDQYFQMYCTFDLDIPKVPKSNGILQFEKEGSGIKLKMFPINVDVEGPGYVKFYSGAKQGDQQLKPGEFTAVGEILDKEGIKLKGKLYRTVDKIWVDVDPKGQIMPLGQGNTSLANIEGKMEVNKNTSTWTNFTFNGEMKGFKGMQGNLRKTFTVYGSIKADQESIDVKNIPTPFGGMDLTYDIKNARLTGNMELKKNIGALSLNGLANIVVDGSGWYFLSGGLLSTPGLGNISAGMLIGDYNIMPVNVSEKLMQFAYDKTVPASFKTGVSGFFFTGEKDLPFINVPDFSIDLGILSASMGAKAGLDGRLWMDFNDAGNNYGIGAMAFAYVYFKAASITCTKLGAEARAELGAKGMYATSNGTFTVKGCGSITVTGSAKQCFPTPCLSDGVCCTGCIGDSISKGIRVDILLDSQGNTDLSFDFGNCSGQPTMSSNW